MNKKIRLGILGGGGDSLIGVLHRVASSMFDRYEIIGGVFNPNYEENLSFAKKLGLKESRIYKDFETMVEVESKLDSDERIEVVSVLTPNFLHYPMAKKLLENNFHVICEKPLTTTYKEALDLKKIQSEKKLVFAVTYTYTGYPMVRQMTKMIADGVIGKLHKVDAQYLQGWLNPVIHEKEKRNSTWRLNPEKSGISCCVGDIGTHAFNMVELVTGMKVKSVLADLNTLYEDNPMDVDANILIQFSTNMKGTIRSSQIATGEENNFRLSIYGDKGAVHWKQENPNYATLSKVGVTNQIITRGGSIKQEGSSYNVRIPAGHPEGYLEAFAQIYSDAADVIQNKENKSELIKILPNIDDGLQIMKFINASVDSSKNNSAWVDLSTVK